MLYFFRKVLLVTLITMLSYFLIGCPKKHVEEPVTTTTTPAVEPYKPPPPPPKPPETITPDETNKDDGKVKDEKMTPPPVEPPVETPPEPTAVEKLETIYFDYDKSNIRTDAQETLSHNASWLKKDENVDAKILIEGHCDERGTDEYNMALGDRRANSSKKFFVNMGIKENRIDTISYGESRPAVEGHDEDAWKWNRRSEFVITK